MKANYGIIPVLMLAGCVTTPVVSTIPECELLIPPSLLAPVEGASIPATELHQDGHEQAEPWQIGYLEQTGQLDKANERPTAIDHIYRNCLQMHRNALAKSQRGFFGRLFGG